MDILKFSRVPQLIVGLVREKTHSIAVSRRDKSLGDTVYSCLLGFFIFRKNKTEVLVLNMNWIKVFVAAIFEVFWVIGLKHAYDFWTWSGTVISILISFYAMIMAGKKLPVGTVYAVFVGLGTAGTVFSDIVFFDEPFKPAKIILIMVLLAGVIGLKLVTSDKVEKGVDS